MVTSSCVQAAVFYSMPFLVQAPGADPCLNLVDRARHRLMGTTDLDETV